MPTKRKTPTRVPRQLRSRETVRAIVDAVELLLKEAGPAAVTPSRVAERAGVSHGTLYEYFADKDALLQAAEERSWGHQVQRMAAKMVELENDPLDEAIAEIVRFAIDTVVERGSAHGITADDPGTREARIAVVDQIAAFATSQLARYADRVRPENVPLALKIVVKAVAALSWLGVRDHGDELDTGEYQREVARMVVRYLVRDAQL